MRHPIPPKEKAGWDDPFREARPWIVPAESGGVSTAWMCKRVGSFMLFRESTAKRAYLPNKAKKGLFIIGKMI